MVIPFRHEVILGYTVTYTNRGTRAYQHQSSGVLADMLLLGDRGVVGGQNLDTTHTA